MGFFDNAKCWFNDNKKIIHIGGSVVLAIIGAGVGYVLYKNNSISFSDWLKTASKEELNEAYKKLYPLFHKTGTKPYEMEQISHELGLRAAQEWFGKHPPNLDPYYRWTDANRWE